MDIEKSICKRLFYSFRDQSFYFVIMLLANRMLLILYWFLPQLMGASLMRRTGHQCVRACTYEPPDQFHIHTSDDSLAAHRPTAGSERTRTCVHLLPELGATIVGTKVN